MSRSYVILEASDVASIDFDQVLETSADTLRYSLDNSQTFVKYDGNKPRFLYGKTAYTHSQILETLDSAEWTDPNIE